MPIPSSDPTVTIELGGKRVCRVNSNHERKGRFMVERLCDVRCLLLSSLSPSHTLSPLLRIACPNNCLQNEEDDEATSCLTLSIKDDHYNMEITEFPLSSQSSSNEFHCVLCAIATDNEKEAIEAINTIKHLIDDNLITCPVLVLAYRIDTNCEPSSEVMHSLRDLARRPTAFHCLECSAVTKSLLRRCMALCLIAARPFLGSVKGAEDLKFDDEIRAVKPKVRRSSLASKITEKKKVHKMCHIQ